MTLRKTVASNEALSAALPHKSKDRKVLPNRAPLMPPPVVLNATPTRNMAVQWARRAMKYLRPDGAAAGVTLPVMRQHLTSADAIPVSMPEYRELRRVASLWEAWEVRRPPRSAWTLVRPRVRGHSPCAFWFGRVCAWGDTSSGIRFSRLLESRRSRDMGRGAGGGRGAICWPLEPYARVHS